MALPRYLEIERALRDDIERLQPGDLFPSDAEICERFGVSRVTARNGIRRLAEAGLVERRPGQGTFVAEPTVRRRAGRLLSFSEDMLDRGLTPSSRLLSIEQTTPTPHERDALGVSGVEPVSVVSRLRLANDVPMAIERVVLPRRCAAALDTDLEHGSLHEALTQIGLTPTSARGTIESQSSTESDAELLEVTLATPLLVERRTVFDELRRPLEFTETRYSPSRYVFDIELVRSEHDWSAP